jgi:hypothetical protein
MKNSMFKGYKKGIAVSCLLIFVFSLFNFDINSREAKAAPNLIRGGSFENIIDNDWAIWQNQDSVREYEFFRSYDSEFGLGSYSAAVSVTGDADERWDAGLVTKNSFAVESGASYYFVFWAKATRDIEISMFLENAANYAGITPGANEAIGTEWEKHIVLFTPTATVDAFVSFIFGDLPTDVTLHLDGTQIFKSDVNVNTKELKGYIGNNNKFIQISNLVNFTEEDIEIELPFFDNITGNATTKRFRPDRISATGAYISFYDGTYSGIARVHVNGAIVGSFNYTVTPKASEFFPSLVRAGEDLVVSGTGFTPNGGNTFLVINVMNHEGRTIESWIPADSTDSYLTQAVFKLPIGVVSGRVHLYTSYLNMEGAEVVGRSNYMAYNVMPVIDHIDWSKKGYEQVGDKLRIYGKGLSARPYVNFYNDAGEKVDTKAAKLIEIGEFEVVEVDATSVYNKFNIKVMAHGIESNDHDAIEYSAKPKFKNIVTKYRRNIQSTASNIQAAKIGDKIKLTGSGLKPMSGDAVVEFQGVNERIESIVDVASVALNGTYVEIIVPAGAQNGHININVNGEKSNYIPLEIIPTIESISPNPIIPGSDILIIANGIGLNINMAKVHFGLDKNNAEVVQPTSITFADGHAVVRVKAPMAMSSQNTVVNLEYDRWKDNGSSVLNVNPVVVSASINMDNKILTIRGYGFSIYPRENEITYKYADTDRTVIKPRVRMLGVYPTEEGQEIRIQILDEYHYGYVQVRVGGLESDEVNFGPVSIAKISRRVEYVSSLDAVMGVMYINGYNLGTEGGVRIGDHWADVHYRTNFFIIAVIDEQYLYENPVIVTRE